MKRLMRGWIMRQRLAILLLFSAVSVTAAHSRPSLNLLVLQSSGVQPVAASTAEAQVVMKAISFQPAELTVHPGETVEWKNEDIVAHTVTANDGSFDSGSIQPGSTWKMTIKNAGTLEYHCRPHPNMIAKLIAVSGTQPEPGKGNTGFRLPGLTPPRSPQELHPILVNFTAALLPLALLSDLLGRLLKRPPLHSAAAWMVLYAAIITPLTGLAGWWWKSQAAGALPPNLITVHQWLGTSLVVVFALLAMWRWRIQKQGGVPTIGYLIFTGIVVLALIYQGSLGGAMVFGR